MINAFNTLQQSHQIKKKSERISKIKPFVNKCNWNGIYLPSEKDYWKKSEKNTPLIALNVLCL